MRNKSYICMLLAALCLVTGCSKKNTITIDENTIHLESKPSENLNLLDSPYQKWHITNKRIFVLFGYGFNDEESVEKYKSVLAENFGLDEDGGLVYPVVFPIDFKHNGRFYASDLTSLINDDSKELCGMILLGAPDNTHTALARVQDFWNMKVPYPVVALFSQDEILGMESTCDVVVDLAKSTEFGSEEDQVQEITEGPEIVKEAVAYLALMDSPMNKDRTLTKHVAQMFPDRKILHYIDPETGLQSINHFVLN